MNQAYNKQSESQQENQLYLNQQEITSFLHYLSVSQACSHNILRVYDSDINLKENREYYINKTGLDKSNSKSAKLSQSNISNAPSKKTVTKSIKPKMQIVKKSQIPLIRDPQSEMISKLNGNNPTLLSFRYEQLIPSLPEHSNIKIEEGSVKSNSLKIVENKSKFEQSLNNESSIKNIPQQKEGESNKIILPMLQKKQENRFLKGQKAQKIDVLNQFMNNQQVKIEKIYIRSNINKQFVEKSARKNKIQNCPSTPSSKLKQIVKQKNVDQTINKIFDQPKSQNKQKVVESRLINQIVISKQISKSKSKSKSKLKKVKDNTLFQRKPKLMHPVAQYPIHLHTGIIHRKDEVSPQFYHAPVTHIKSFNEKEISKHSKGKKTQKENTVVPVQDYDLELDRSKRNDLQSHQEYNMSDNQQNVKVNTPLISNMSATPQKKLHMNGKSKKSSRGNASVECQPLPYYAIPMQTIQNKKKVVQTPVIAQTEKKSFQNFDTHIRIVEDTEDKKQNEKNVRSQRKKIFSQLQKQRREQKYENSEGSDYTEEEMRMILGAKGNKYKQTIIKTYIRLQRTTTQNKPVNS